MQFNSEANNQDIVSDIKFLLTGSYNGSLDYHINDITRNVNRRYDETAMLIYRADGKHQWDDDNNTTAPTNWTEVAGDTPIVARNLVAGQQVYSIASADFLEIVEVAIKDINGKFQVLTPVDRNKGNAQSLADLESGSTGMPQYYDKIGPNLFLFPKPSASFVTTTLGLRVTFKRLPSYFAVGDTTKTPGFAPSFHRILSVGPSIDYCLANGLSKKQASLEGQLQKLQEGLIEHYAARSKDEQTRLGLHEEDYGQSILAGGGVSESRFNI